MHNDQQQNTIPTQCIILQQEQSQQTQIHHIRLNTVGQFIDLKQIFQNHIKNYKTFKYRIHDNIKNQYQDIQYLSKSRYKIPLNFINYQHNLILIKYRRLTFQEAHVMRETQSQVSDKEAFSDSFSYKKQRSKQRALYQVIQLVKKWRELHQSLNKTKKVSLQQTAKIMGMSKKSLDDYYYQLRLGQKYGFDYKNNYYQKIGVLRTYLKSRNSHLKQKKSDLKHCKGLHVLGQFDDFQQSVASSKNSKKIHILNEKLDFFEQHYEKQDAENRLMMDESEQHRRIKLQNQFYQNFGFQSCHEDPFINLDKSINNDKKNQIFFEQQSFF